MNILRFVLIVFFMLSLYNAVALADDDYVAARQQMVDHINKVAAKTAKYTDRSEFDSRVMQVMGAVPRHRFVPDDQLENAYTNRPLPIGYGQTISEPYVVALMTELLRTQPDQKVLEIGTGSGYQAAVLSELAAEVVSIERIGSLAEVARRRLDELGYQNVDVREGDGTLGYPDGAPYRGIMVTAGAPAVPRPLLEQLTLGGKLVVPVGERHTQVLEIITRSRENKFDTRRDTACRFVDLIGEHGW
jgi:protein-L-isoaspartate(D-aspartate) O-methyltransferase